MANSTKAAQPKAGREVASAILMLPFKEVERKGLPPETLLEGIPYSLDHLLDRSERIDWASFGRFLDNVNSIWTEEEVRSMNAKLSDDWAVQYVYNVARLLYTVKEFYWWVMKPEEGLIHRYISCVKTSVSEVGEDRLFIEITMKEGYEAFPAFFEGVNGTLIGLSTIVGQSQSRVEMTPIEGGARYDVRLPRGGGSLAWLRKAISWPITARDTARDLQQAQDLLHARFMELEDQTTERKETLDALKKSEEKFRALVEGISDVMFTLDAEGRFTYMSPSIQGTGNLTPEDVIGLPLTDFIHRDDLAGLQKSFEKTLRGESEPAEFRVITRDREVRHVRTSSTMFWEDGKPAGLRGIMTDITERKEFERALEYRIGLEKLVGSISTHFINLQSDEVDEEVRKALQRVTKFAGGSQCFVVLGTEDLEGLTKVFGWMNGSFKADEAEAAAEAVLSFPWSMDALRSGQMLNVERLADMPPEAETERSFMAGYGVKSFVSVPLLLRNSLRGFLWLGSLEEVAWPDDLDVMLRNVLEVFANAWERKRTEQERIELEAQMQHAQKLESLGVLAGGIAHDFNNLLVGILGNANLASRSLPEDSPARQSITRIEDAAERAADLVNNLLAYAGKGQALRYPLDLSSLVREMAQLLEVSISKKVVVRYDLSSELPAIEGDASQVRQIVMNLITNASEAIGKNQGRVEIRTGVLEADEAYLLRARPIEHLEPGPYVFFEVTDTGSGMDAETQAKLFEPFFTTKFAGRGLGLSAAIGIIRAHGGGIVVESTPGRGSTFRTLFPPSRRSIEVQVDESEVKYGPERLVDFEATILVVDDEDVVRELACEALKGVGFKVLTAVDGQDGVNVYRTHGQDIDAVLLDMTMPHMSGEETFRELRNLNRNVKVVLTSGHTEQDTTAQFDGTGPSGFIQKPYRVDALIDKFKEVLSL